jgi:hypothetical protein
LSVSNFCPCPTCTEQAHQREQLLRASRGDWRLIGEVVALVLLIGLVLFAVAHGMQSAGVL